jgi:imidazoleglycerol phosphate synthase glutamine amidotransferase subunit HisH
VIALVDYDSGNLRSVEKALLKAGAKVRVTRTPEGLKDASAVVLPGVGAFDDCLNAMRKQELLAAIKDFIKAGRPFLGICVGYQALFERSEEFNSCAAGLEIFPGSVVRFAAQPGLKIPQIGWNQLDIAPCIAASTPAVTFILCIVFFPNPRTNPSPPPRHSTVKGSLPPCGGTMFTPRNSIPRKARMLA